MFMVRGARRAMTAIHAPILLEDAVTDEALHFTACWYKDVGGGKVNESAHARVGTWGDVNYQIMCQCLFSWEAVLR